MGHRATRRDRWLAVGALVAIVAMAAVVLLSVSYQRAIGNSGLGEWSTKGIIVGGVLFGLPLALEIGACVSRGTVGTVLRWASVAVLGLLILFAFGRGIVFLPALGLMVAAAAASEDSTATSGSEMSDA